MEKRPVLLYLAVVLVVSLGSFVLGILVGRHGVVQSPPVVEVSPPEVVAPAPPEPVAPAEPVSPPVERFTFYETLMPGGAKPPLGSGINLPPAKTPLAVPAPAPVSAAPPASKKTAAAATVAAGEGSQVVQVASFREAKDAAALVKRLVDRGYPAFQEQADLGGRGVWSRVLVGPFADTAAAEATVRHLQQNEKLAAMIKRR